MDPLLDDPFDVLAGVHSYGILEHHHVLNGDREVVLRSVVGGDEHGIVGNVDASTHAP